MVNRAVTAASVESEAGHIILTASTSYFSAAGYCAVVTVEIGFDNSATASCPARYARKTSSVTKAGRYGSETP